MKTNKNNNKEVYIGLTALVGLILIIILASSLTPGSVFQGSIKLNPAAGRCTSLSIKSIPASLRSGQAAVIIAQTQPADWQGMMRFSASSGIILDSLGNEGSLIETTDRIVDFSGGSTGDIITIQAAGEGNEGCLATITIQKPETKFCESLSVKTEPSPLTTDQSAKITITTVPADFNGDMVIQADSGTLQSVSADGGTLGENTALMVTSGKVLYYSGGKTGKKIRINVLGEKNAACKDELEIKAR